MLKKIPALVLLLSLMLASCQSGGASKKLQVTLSDFTISLSQSNVRANSEVTIKVTNTGTVEHDFSIMKYGADIGDQFDDEDRANVLLESVVQSGETKSQSFTVPEQPGTYQVVCAMPGHVQAGMVGTLEVVK